MSPDCHNEENDKSYEKNRKGLSRELARINLTLNTYTQWYWKIDLHNFMHFVNLRAEDHSQFEIREYGKTLIKILKSWAPLTYDAFMSYKFSSSEISREGLDVIKKMIAGKRVSIKDTSLSKREWNELQTLLK